MRFSTSIILAFAATTFATPIYRPASPVLPGLEPTSGSGVHDEIIKRCTPLNDDDEPASYRRSTTVAHPCPAWKRWAFPNTCTPLNPVIPSLPALATRDEAEEPASYEKREAKVCAAWKRWAFPGSCQPLPTKPWIPVLESSTEKRDARVCPAWKRWAFPNDCQPLKPVIPGLPILTSRSETKAVKGKRVCAAWKRWAFPGSCMDPEPVLPIVDEIHKRGEACPAWKE